MLCQADAFPAEDPNMETSITSDSALPEHRRTPWRAESVQPAFALGLRATTLLGALPRAARRLLDRVGMGLQRFDDNLWDGGDET
jgi:hypothetical protein